MSPVAATMQPGIPRNGFDHRFRRSSRFHITIPIWKTNDGICAGNINPFWMWPAGIEVNTERNSEVTCEDFHMLGLAIGANTAQYDHVVGLTVREEEISIRGCSKKTRVHESVCIKLDLEPRRCLRQSSCRARHQIGVVHHGVCSVWFGKRSLTVSFRLIPGCS
jgi:hypothetical protein